MKVSRINFPFFHKKFSKSKNQYVHLCFKMNEVSTRMLIREIFSRTIFLTRDVSSTKQNISSFFAVLCIEETSITFASILYIILVHKLGVFPPFHPMSPFTTTRSIYCERKLETGCRNSSLRCLYSEKKDSLPRLKKF